MSVGLLGQKVGMTQVYDKRGNVAPVTVLALGPCPVLQIRTKDRDGYDGVQVGYGDKERSRATRAERGHVAKDFSSKRRKALAAAGVQLPEKADCEPQRYIREFRLKEPTDKTIGTVLTVEDVFTGVPAVDVIGICKGRGTAGAMKRHNFAGLEATHGVKKAHRSPGSISSHASDLGSGRPKKGQKMAGRYGNSQITMRNMEIIKIDVENHFMLVKGGVPGPNGGFVIVRPTNKVDRKLELEDRPVSKKKGKK